jgi:hypothetical protein
MRKFKESLMKNEEIVSLQIIILSVECFNIFLNEGNWTNKTIRELDLNGNFHIIYLVGDGDFNRVKCVKNFIKSNTSVNSILFSDLNLDFSEELEFNYNIRELDGEFPWSKFYIERNNHYFKMRNFKSISKVKCFDFYFHFE